MEKSWITDSICNSWEPAFTKKGHEQHAVAGRWGLLWYDGTAQGRPKPIAHVTRFLAEYLSASLTWTHTTQAPRFSIHKDASLPGVSSSFMFEAEDAIFVGGAKQN